MSVYGLNWIRISIREKSECKRKTSIIEADIIRLNTPVKSTVVRSGFGIAAIANTETIPAAKIYRFMLFPQ